MVKLKIDIWILGVLGFLKGKLKEKIYIDMMKQSFNFTITFPQAFTMLHYLSFDVKLK